MIQFLLWVLVCTSATDCQWHPIEPFSNEENCRDLGRSYMQDEQVMQFKCVVGINEKWRRWER